VKDRILYLAYRCFVAVISRLPRRAVVWLGRRLGAAYYWIDGRGRRAGLENLRRAFPDRTDHARILLESQRGQAVALLDAAWSARLTPLETRRYIEIGEEGRRTLAAAMARGRGLVAASAHFGSWELLAFAGPAIGFPPAAFLARPIENPLIDRHLRGLRERGGNQLVYRKGGLVRCLQALKRGEAASSVIDIALHPSEGGVFVDCFGTPAATSTALASLAYRLDAPLVLLLASPRDKGRRYVVAVEEIPVDAGAERDAEILRATQALTHALEAHVRRDPAAWLWAYKRWKWRPSELTEEFPSYSTWVTYLA